MYEHKWLDSYDLFYNMILLIFILFYYYIVYTIQKKIIYKLNNNIEKMLDNKKLK